MVSFSKIRMWITQSRFLVDVNEVFQTLFGEAFVTKMREQI